MKTEIKDIKELEAVAGGKSFKASFKARLARKARRAKLVRRRRGIIAMYLRPDHKYHV